MEQVVFTQTKPQQDYSVSSKLCDSEASLDWCHFTLNFSGGYWEAVQGARSPKLWTTIFGDPCSFTAEIQLDGPGIFGVLNRLSGYRSLHQTTIKMNRNEKKRLSMLKRRRKLSNRPPPPSLLMYQSVPLRLNTVWELNGLCLLLISSAFSEGFSWGAPVFLLSSISLRIEIRSRKICVKFWITVKPRMNKPCRNSPNLLMLSCGSRLETLILFRRIKTIFQPCSFLV